MRTVSAPLQINDSEDNYDSVSVVRGNRVCQSSSGYAVDALLRPDDIVRDPNSQIRATVRSRAFKGANILYSLTLALGTSILSLFPPHHDHGVGEQVGIRVAADQLIVFPVG